MNTIIDALIDKASNSLLLTSATSRAWPFIQPLFAPDGYFPNGITLIPTNPVASSVDEVKLVGTATIDRANFAAEATFSGSGPNVELELVLTVTLASLAGKGSALRAAWEPKVTFRSNAGKKAIHVDAARGTVRIGSIKLEAEVKLPSLRIEATLTPEEHGESLSTVMGAYALDDVKAGLKLKEIRLHAYPSRGAY